MNNAALDHDAKIYFRDQLKEARANALGDAEAFTPLVFCVENLGAALTQKIGTLSTYRTGIARLAACSRLAEEIPGLWREHHTPFSTLYESVRIARNDALHQGAFARHLTVHAIGLALVLEDALMENFSSVSDYMVQNPVSANLWQPVSFIRQAMLTSSFSYLPLLLEQDQRPVWYLISDHSVACYVRRGDRQERLAKTLKEAIDTGGIQPEKADMCQADTSIDDALKLTTGRPILVRAKDDETRLLGILTPFDLL